MYVPCVALIWQSYSFIYFKCAFLKASKLVSTPVGSIWFRIRACQYLRLVVSNRLCRIVHVRFRSLSVLRMNCVSCTSSSTQFRCIMHPRRGLAGRSYEQTLHLLHLDPISFAFVATTIWMGVDCPWNWLGYVHVYGLGNTFSVFKYTLTYFDVHLKGISLCRLRTRICSTFVCC